MSTNPYVQPNAAGTSQLTITADARAPFVSAVAVTPSNTTPLGPKSRGLYIGGAGNVALTLIGDTTTVTLTAVPVGTTLYMAANLVMSTGTTATNIVALY